MKMDLSFARIYAKSEDRDSVKKFEQAHETDKCDDMDTFKEKYLELLAHSYIPEFMKNHKDPNGFVDGWTGIGLMQKLNDLLGQLRHVSHYASANVKMELQAMVTHFWQLGKAWEKENLKNRLGNPSTIFEDVERHTGTKLFQSSESHFKTYVKH